MPFGPQGLTPAPALRRRRFIDPDAWLEGLCWAVVAFSCLQLVLYAFGRDQSIYAVVGEGITRGRMPYRDLWDFKPPGIFVVYALAQSLLGKTMLAPRLVEAAGLVAMVFGLGRLGAELFGSRTAGLVGGALAALIHAQLEFWHTGQPESFGAFLTVGALVLTVVRPGAAVRRWLAWAGVGVLFGAAFLLKPPLGGGAVVSAIHLARLERWRTGRVAPALVPVGIIGLSSMLPIVACALWFWWRDAWSALWWTFFEFTPGYTALGQTDEPLFLFYHAVAEVFTGFSAVIPVGVVAAFFLQPLHSRERDGVFLVLGVVSVHVAGIAMQAKFFQYHYGATLPLVAFVAGLGVYKLWRRCLYRGALPMVALAGVVALLLAVRSAVRYAPVGFWGRSVERMAFLFGGAGDRTVLDGRLYFATDYDLDANRRVAAAIVRRTPPGTPVFVWGFEPGIYWLSERPPASRYIYDVPQRVTWGRERARAELIADLERTPPAIFVVQTGDVFVYVTGDDRDSREALESFPELWRFLMRHYDLLETVEAFEVYERRAGPSDPW